MEQQRASKRQRTGSPSALPSPPQQAAAAAPSDPSRIWLPEYVQRFAASLPPNEVACVLRLVNKAAAAQFRGPQHATVRLSQPVPHREFAWRWAGPDAMRRLVWSQREALPRLTARSGSIANLEVLLAHEGVANPLNHCVFSAAAAAGQMEVCIWLRERGCRWSVEVLAAAAGGGHRAVCEWLLANGCSKGRGTEAAAAAARGGHVGMMDWLLGGSVPGGLSSRVTLMQAAASGCDLPTLQRLHHTYLDSRVEELRDWDPSYSFIREAAGSRTEDWQAKVEWPEAQGCPLTSSGACNRAACMPDALTRLQWLQHRGCPVDVEAARYTTVSGDLGVLQYVLDQGIQVDGDMMVMAASQGHVAFMQALHARGAWTDADVVGAAARRGHLHAVAWLVEILGADRALTANVFAKAAEGSSMEMLVWLRARGCPWDAATFHIATLLGSAEQLEWLMEHGCPMVLGR